MVSLKGDLLETLPPSTVPYSASRFVPVAVRCVWWLEQSDVAIELVVKNHRRLGKPGVRKRSSGRYDDCHGDHNEHRERGPHRHVVVRTVWSQRELDRRHYWRRGVADADDRVHLDDHRTRFWNSDSECEPDCG